MKCSDKETNRIKCIDIETKQTYGIRLWVRIPVIGKDSFKIDWMNGSMTHNRKYASSNSAPCTYRRDLAFNGLR